ncbi:MAG: hypothetical protein GWO24_27465, partial [Akkermansiaceae bacterium]|nr:hypothetical protein [Akkermansiaceae bacterium]
VAEAPGGHRRSWQLPEARRTHPGLVHAVAGEEIRIPSFGPLERSEVALLAESSAGYTADVFDKLSLEKGFLVAKGLAAGDYKLLLKRSGQSIALRVAKGTRSTGH